MHRDIYVPWWAYGRNEPVDLFTLSNRLKKKMLERIGGRTYLVEISNAVPTSSHIVNYGQIIRRKSLPVDWFRLHHLSMDLAIKKKEDV
jgi:replicative DNA helicase